ncbi:MAG: ABC transporter substrate-binding protein [Treponema sp.]|nr:ABC transporter substrate-binding protein [Treponema sp.]
MISFKPAQLKKLLSVIKLWPRIKTGFEKTGRFLKRGAGNAWYALRAGTGRLYRLCASGARQAGQIAGLLAGRLRKLGRTAPVFKARAGKAGQALKVLRIRLLRTARTQIRRRIIIIREAGGIRQLCRRRLLAFGQAVKTRAALHRTEAPAVRYSWYGGLALLLVSLVINLSAKAGTTFSIINIPDNQTLVFTQWWEDALDPLFLETLIGDYEAQHPDIKIFLDTRPYGEIQSYLTAEEGKEPFKTDILGLDPRWSLEGNEKLESQGKYRAQALVSFMIPLFYNIELLEEAGFDRPPKTQAEFIAFARAVTKREEDRYGLALALAPEDPLGVYRDIFPWIWAGGARLLKDGKLDFDNSKVVGTLKFLRDLNRDGLIAPDSFTKTGKDRLLDFKARRTAMLLAPVNTLVTDVPAEGAPFYGLTAVPGLTSMGKPVLAISGWYAGIAQAGRYKAEALSFVHFLANEAPRIAAHTRGIPWNSGATDGAAGKAAGNTETAAGEDALISKAHNIYQAAEIQEELSLFNDTRFLEEIVREELQRMFEKGQSPEDTAAAVQRRWEKNQNPS